jgi:hypothetical protein
MRKPAKQKPDSGKLRPFASKAIITARIILAVAMLLTLVAGSIVLPAVASGPLCALACCAGRAPHAAGSCLHGSCQAGNGTPNSASKSRGHSHQHHEKHQAQESDRGDAPSGFAGVTASVGGSDMENVPTVDANTDGGKQPGTSDLAESTTIRSEVSATVLSKPCPPDCGACASSFAAPKRSRNTATLSGSNRTHRPSLLKFAYSRRLLQNAHSAFGRQYVPRGPPLCISC